MFRCTLTGSGTAARRWLRGGLLGAILLSGGHALGDAGSTDGSGGPPQSPEAGLTDTAPSECSSSLACAPPTPYCDRGAGRCVECLGDRNCAATTGLCDLALGQCIGCATDLDCSARTPYCDDSAARCVECRVDSNCGDIGIECLEGVCGACGDGICGPDERALDLFGAGFVRGDGVSPVTRCPDDCAADCPSRDLASALGTVASLDTSDWTNRYRICTEGDNRDASFVWTAPEAGSYYFSTVGSTVEVAFAIVSGDCETALTNAAYECGYRSNAYFVERQFDAGEAALLLVELDDEANGVVQVTVSDQPVCIFPDGGTGDCPDQDDADAGGLDQAGLCQRNAEARGDPDCAGARCACDHCPLDYDDCAVIPGCMELLACMARTKCIGDQCTRADTCGEMLEARGGPEGAAFRAAASLQSCALSFSCDIPCVSENGSGEDAGRSRGDAGVDASAACEPGVEGSCRCADGGTGGRTCGSDGQLSPCDCEGTPSASASGGCGCKLSTQRSTGTAPVAAAMLLLGMVLRRAKRGKRRKRA